MRTFWFPIEVVDHARDIIPAIAPHMDAIVCREWSHEEHPVIPRAVWDLRELAAIYGLQFFWCRGLWWRWHQTHNPYAVLFDRHYYDRVIGIARTEAEALGAEHTWLDCEMYGNYPLKSLWRDTANVYVLDRLQTALPERKVAVVLPVGSSNPYRIMWPLSLLGKQAVNEKLYYKNPGPSNPPDWYTPNEIRGVFVTSDGRLIADKYQTFTVAEAMALTDEDQMWYWSHDSDALSTLLGQFTAA
jgi:hypothetical protein